MKRKESEKDIPEAAKEMARYAYGKVPLYREVAIKNHITNYEFENLPFVNKAVYMQATVPYLSDDFKEKYQKHEIYVGKTSGSTGKVTEVYWDFNDEKKSLMELWFYRRKYYNILPQDRMCFFSSIGDNGPDIMEENSAIKISNACIYNGKLRETYELILKFQPKWIIMHPSMAWLLCKLIHFEKMSPPSGLKYIEFTGEYLQKNVRKEVERTFCCKTANQYGIREVNSIAYECPCGNMHVMSNNAYVEILNPEDAIGDICVTSLKNRALPYIRYITGDKGMLKYRKCACGNPNPILEVCNGRDNDWIYKKDGSKLHPFTLLGIVGEIDGVFNDCIMQYQLIQKNYDYFVYRFVIRNGIDYKKMEKKVCQMMAERLHEEFTVRFQYFDQLIPDVATGKIAAFICEIE